MMHDFYQGMSYTVAAVAGVLTAVAVIAIALGAVALFATLCRALLVRIARVKHD